MSNRYLNRLTALEYRRFGLREDSVVLLRPKRITEGTEERREHRVKQKQIPFGNDNQEGG
jgi:hypothetical protein